MTEETNLDDSWVDILLELQNNSKAVTTKENSV
jgi:hypothetical protein